MYRRASACWIPLSLASLAAIFLVARLGNGSLSDWDESIYAQQAKEMVQRGDWMTPYWGYDLWLNKPPLYLWSAALLFQFFGVSEFWARLPSALSGIALVLLTFSMTASA